MTAPGPWHLERVESSEDLIPATLPVATSSTRRVLLKAWVPANPGDLLDITSRAQITNDTGRVIGCGYALWTYDIDLAPAVPIAQQPWLWAQIAPHLADNCPPDRHHMPLHMAATWQVPPDWPPGHRVQVLLQAAAFRTAPAPGETVRVDDGYGQLVVRRYVPAPQPV